MYVCVYICFIIYWKKSKYFKCPYIHMWSLYLAPLKSVLCVCQGWDNEKLQDVWSISIISSSFHILWGNSQIHACYIILDHEHLHERSLEPTHDMIKRNQTYCGISHFWGPLHPLLVILSIFHSLFLWCITPMVVNFLSFSMNRACQSYKVCPKRKCLASQS